MSTTSASDVLVVGGGVIGLAVARALARDGASVTVLERHRPARGATWAAGGMLAPLGEAPDPGPFLSFGLESLAAWPAWARALEVEGEGDVGWSACGKLLVASGGEAGERLRARHAWQAADGHDARWVEGDGVRDLEPALAERWSAGLWLPDHARVDPRRLGPVLARAARVGGAAVEMGEEVAEVCVEGGRAVGVVTADGTRWPAGAVVLAAGAWSGTLAGLPRPLPVRPIRGQMLALALDRPRVSGLVAGPGAYLIPRDGDDGRPWLVVGASMEEAGFAVETDDVTIDGLRRAAEDLVPALRGLPEVARWAGLRPGTPDDLPLLGADPEVEGLVYATGHHRNGILLAPATAEAVRDLLAGGETDPRWAAFDPARFGDRPP